MSLPTPRILPSHLHAFAPSAHPTITTVRLLGTITALRGDQATLESCHRETVTLILNRDSHLSLHSLYEIIGRVINLEGGHGLGVKVLGATEWPSSAGTGSKGGAGVVDLNAYEAVVDATHRFRGIFYEDEGDDATGGGGGKGNQRGGGGGGGGGGGTEVTMAGGGF